MSKNAFSFLCFICVSSVACYRILGLLEVQSIHEALELDFGATEVDQKADLDK